MLLSLGPQESSDFDGSQIVIGPIQDFLDCLDEIDVVYHAYSGVVFTWCNKKEEAPLFKKLDRVLINHCWMQEFPNAKVLGQQKALEEVQHMGLYCLNVDFIAREKQISQELNDLLRVGEKFLRQKSRV
ncbi:hypothetical protein V6N11_007833 [Hibiscus sabdariffa]|uniref:Uncharacterized protein n=1 Tax=Hibiscus sabdariffa TaxID=183260 RepID=A0ABR2PYT4_9ROSI